jgi:hypothetical protein
MRKLSKLISMVLAVSMLLCLAPSFQVVAYDFPDMPDEGYWSYTALNNAVRTVFCRAQTRASCFQRTHSQEHKWPPS